MLLKENAVYKHACVRCYQLYTIPRNSLIPSTHRLYLHILKNEKPREKKKKAPFIGVLLQRNFNLFLLFGFWKHPVMDTRTSLGLCSPAEASPLLGRMLLFISSLNLLFQLRPSLSSSHGCQSEALGSILSGTSALALGGLCWGLLKPSLLQP